MAAKFLGPKITLCYKLLWPSEKKLRLGKYYREGKIDGKRERGRPKRQRERDIRDVFNISLSSWSRIDINFFFNPLNPKIKIGILIVSPNSFPIEVMGGS